MNAVDMQRLARHRHHGKAMAIIALLTIPFWLLISDGYNARLGVIGSFYYSMTIYEDEWFCRDVKTNLPYYFEKKCTNVSLPTKYLVTISALATAYGIVIFLGILPSPIDKIRMLGHRNNTDPKIT